MKKKVKRRRMKKKVKRRLSKKNLSERAQSVKSINQRI